MSVKERLGLTREPLFLMDGTAFIYRGFYVNRGLQRSDGFPTNALVVVTRMLLRILREEKPAYFVFVMDGKGPNFRHDLFPLYKANREATPEDLIRQIEPVLRIVRALGLPVEVSSGCEADDCIASLAARFSSEHPVVIVSGDKDLRQCLSPDVSLWDPASKESRLLTESDFVEESGLRPEQWADVQALIGDTADNIPGVPGIGPKTAAKLFAGFQSLEDIRDRFDSIDPKLQAKLREHLDAIFLYRSLTRLRRDFCSHLTLESLKVQPAQTEELSSLAVEFEMNALRREIESLLRLQQKNEKGAGVGGGTASSASAKGSAGQLSLLSLASAPQQHSPSLVEECSDVALLPDCSGKTVSLVHIRGVGNAPIIALDRKQWRYTGESALLCEWVEQAGQIVVPSLKALLEHEKTWEKIPVSQWFDLGLAVYLLHPEEGDYAWARLAARWGSQSSYGTDEAGLQALEMASFLRERLVAESLLALYTTMEMPLIPILVAMERDGLGIDATAFSGFLSEVQMELDTLTSKVYAAAGGEFNIRSAQQLGEVLFSSLQLPSSKKTKGGQLATDQMTLEKLAEHHPVVENVLQFRKLEKMRSTYLEPLPRLVDSQGRIHTTFNQTATATGRLSSSNPNLQNIPVRGDLGKRMRRCFVAPTGMKLVSADYSQVELRVLAHMSGEETLLEAFRQGEDIHMRTAALMFDLPPEEVSSDQRRQAKTINFGLLYGMGAQKLGRELHITMAQAKSFIEHYFEHMRTLKMFYEGVENFAREHGYVTTLAGRRRPLPEILSANEQLAAASRRQAVNTVIQGSAADIIKLAMLHVHQDATLAAYGARLVLQVHDELLLEVPQEQAQAAGERVALLMRSVCPDGKELRIPLEVDWGLGSDWGSAH